MVLSISLRACHGCFYLVKGQEVATTYRTAVAKLMFTFELQLMYVAKSLDSIPVVEYKIYDNSNHRTMVQTKMVSMETANGTIARTIPISLIAQTGKNHFDIEIVNHVDQKNGGTAQATCEAIVVDRVQYVSSTTVDVYGMPGMLAILPPCLALMMTILTKHVLLSLYLGVLLGSTIVEQFDPVAGLARSLDTIIPQAAMNHDHTMVLLYCWLISGLVCLISKSGGAIGLADQMIAKANSSKAGQVCAWIVGMVVVFDDYANILIVGNVMSPITKRLRISSEKLAYIAHTTAVTIASVVPISSMVSFELILLSAEFKKAGIKENPYYVYLETIPLRMYALLSLVFCGLLIVTQRDFGPMLHVEQLARRGEKTEDGEDTILNNGGKSRSIAKVPLPELLACYDSKHYMVGFHFDRVKGAPKRWYNAVLPLACSIFTMFFGMICDAYLETIAHDTFEFDQFLANVAPFRSLMWSSVVAFFIPVTMYWYQGIFTAGQSTCYWVLGMKEFVEPALLLILAWSLGNVVQELQLSRWLLSILENSWFLGCIPTVSFLLAAFISGSTGSSWSTLSILYPIVIPLIWEHKGQDYHLLLLTIGAVSSGAIFGDHCSPLSDSTALSSVASHCRFSNHTYSQLPYSLVAAALTLLCTIIDTHLVNCDMFYFKCCTTIFAMASLFIMVIAFGTAVPNYAEENPMDDDEFLQTVFPNIRPIRPRADHVVQNNYVSMN